MIYENPIIPGFAPDPSVVLVNSTFYLVNSSFHLFPGLPVYASQNLKEWVHIGNAINRPNQLSLQKATVDGFPIGGGQAIVAATGLFAPTLRYHKGVFYVVCTNVRKQGDRLNTQSFYVTTRNIWSNKWSDPIYFDFEGIDPSLYFDEDGDRAYIQGSLHAGPLSNPKCSIRQFEVDICTGKPLSEIKTIWTGHLNRGDVEGPHIYKKDDHYYLVVAEGGTWQHHCITIARSASIWGPYESYAANPILTADGKEEYVQHTGHGELFQDAKGNWWVVHLGVRSGEDGRAPLGRETFLTPVNWPTGGWPEIQQTRISFDAVEVGSQVAKLEKMAPVDIEFLYLRNPQLADYTILPNQRQISIVARENDLSIQEGTATFLAQRQRHLTSTATATLHLQRDPVQQVAVPLGRAGLSLFKDDVRHVEVYYNYDANLVELSHTDKIKHKSNAVVLSQYPVSKSTDRIVFEIRATPNEYKFFFRELIEGNEDQQTEWICSGLVDSLQITASDFTGPCFGIFATTRRSKDDDIPTSRKFPEVLFEDFAVL